MECTILHRPTKKFMIYIEYVVLLLFMVVSVFVRRIDCGLFLTLQAYLFLTSLAEQLLTDTVMIQQGPSFVTDRAVFSKF
jgi:hypothetical protein